MTMKAENILEQARDAMTVKRVFGEPYAVDGITVIPVAKVAGGGGGGEGSGVNAQTGSGAGFGLGAVPVGMYVIRDGVVLWQPALDVNRLILGGQILIAFMLLTLRAIIRLQARAKATEPIKS